ncbi:hypothetical protein FNV43_RR00660 [Rhamnella rubrinervis]|uniref:PPPDE domain-containing protein n=1 Tax=Rhamnella rubrinervis TaxID=2594499 RepID=A0A8K0HN93_9ROSA|nr:hypothetical protein FNV43_RR00660 [Rhamnella rubrinervis]
MLVASTLVLVVVFVFDLVAFALAVAAEQRRTTVYGDDEWSFGFCEQGTGVFSCPSEKNPMYTYREAIVLGETNCSIFKVNQILRELSRECILSGYNHLENYE